jgi:hypothetical protein
MVAPPQVRLNPHAAMEMVRRRDQQAQNLRNERRGEGTAQNAAQAPVCCIISGKRNIKLIFL